jgi:hypothetical protein
MYLLDYLYFIYKIGVTAKPASRFAGPVGSFAETYPFKRIYYKNHEVDSPNRAKKLFFGPAITKTTTPP